MPHTNPVRQESAHAVKDVFGPMVIPGDRVVLEVYQGRFRGVISARFIRSTETEIILSYPSYNGHPVPLRKESEVQLSAHTNDGMAIVEGLIDHVVNAPSPMLVVRIPDASSVLLTRQRQFVRANTNIPFDYEIIEQGRRSESKETETVDLSGSGICFTSPKELVPGTKLDIRLKLPSLEPMQIQGKVVRCSHESRKKPHLFFIGVTFVEITLSDQDTIVRYIFELERATGDPSELLPG